MILPTPTCSMTWADHPIERLTENYEVNEGLPSFSPDVFDY